MDHPSRSSRRPQRPATLTTVALASLGLLAGLASCSGSAATRTAATSAPSAAATTSAVASTSTSAGPATGPTTAPRATASAAAVVKEILSTDVDPPGGAGSTLTLIRYTIPPGAKLAPHIHPGVQMASIQSGTLEYSVLTGTATVKRADGTTEQLTGPTHAELHPGDSVIEVDGMVHFGENDADQSVVILASLLTQDGKDLAIPVTQPPR